ncbi:MAG: amino acid ABC transporter substrate-binding protein [Anaerolineaceae bacterium]|nr:amino acid ABC transporter substrate-binding protein [Anaerolineaceae bacterium]
MKRYFFVCSILLLVSILAACQSTPANHWEKIQREGTIIIGTSADYPPFEYVDENGEFAGFDVDVMKELAARLDLELEIIDMPFDSLIAAVRTGKIDIAVAAFNYSEERDISVDFTEAYHYQENGFLVSTDFLGTIDDPEDVANYKLGVQTGSVADVWATEMLVNNGMMDDGNLFRYERVDQAGLDVLNGRIEILMADYYPLLTLEQESTALKIIYHGEVAAGPMMMIIPDNDVETKAEIDAMIDEMISDGFIDSTATAHFSVIK